MFSITHMGIIHSLGQVYCFHLLVAVLVSNFDYPHLWYNRKTVLVEKLLSVISLLLLAM